jgi:hypothetical protein
MNYEEAQAIMDQHRATFEQSVGVIRDVASPIRRRLENETTLNVVSEVFTTSCGPEYELRIFNNPIITYRKGSFSINDHGWYSRTTHMRLNQYMPKGFSVRTRRIPRLPGIKHVGLIKTPYGAYPYNMPTAFSYAGRVENGWYTSEAETALEALPSYIEEYLRRLLNHSPWESDNCYDYYDYSLVDKNPHGHSRTLARCIIENFHFDTLAMTALAAIETTAASPDEFHEGLTLSEIIEVLANEGAEPFKTPRTASQLALREENAIKYRHRIPSIPKAWILTKLRPVLYEYIINSLGFARAEWNRRNNG